MCYLIRMAPLMSKVRLISQRLSKYYHSPMRVAHGTVVSGNVVLDDPAAGRSRGVRLSRETGQATALSADELAELEAGLAEADRDESISGEEFFKQLRRHG
jgi:hypothetical protein